MVGYYPTLEKWWGVCPLADKGAFRVVFVSMDMSVKWCRGSCYLGGYYRSQATSNQFVKPKAVEWVHGIKALGRVAGEYP